MQSVARNLNKTYAATPHAVGDARAQLAEFATAAGATPDQVDAVRLAASEAITNGVLHAYHGQPGSIHVHAAVVGGELWILVSDDGSGLKPRPERSGRGLGLGLGLISQVSEDFSIVSRASGGTEVRIRFTLGHDGAPAPAPARAGKGSRRRSIQPYGFSASVATA